MKDLRILIPMKELPKEWTVNDLMAALGIAKSTAYQRIRKMLEEQKIEKVSEGKGGAHPVGRYAHLFYTGPRSAKYRFKA